MNSVNSKKSSCTTFWDVHDCIVDLGISRRAVASLSDILVFFKEVSSWKDITLFAIAGRDRLILMRFLVAFCV